MKKRHTYDIIKLTDKLEFDKGVLMASNTDDNPSGRLESLSIYKTDEEDETEAE